MSTKIAIRKYRIVDKETNEVVAEDAMFFGKKAFADTGFRKVFVGFLQDVVLDKEISGKAIRLLLYVIENLDPNDLLVYLHRKEVCEVLEISEKNFYLWRNVLVKKGLLLKTNRVNFYMLKPYSAVNGQTQSAITKLNKSSIEPVLPSEKSDV